MFNVFFLFFNEDIIDFMSKICKSDFFPQKYFAQSAGAVE